MGKKNVLFECIIIFFAASILAANYHVFIVPNNFAPAGLNGIATMVQYKVGFSIGYMSLLINIPLCCMAFFFLNKEFALKTMLFSFVYSGEFLFLQNMNFDNMKYYANNNDTIYPVIISGVISGTVYGFCTRANGSTGGTDVVARYINKIKPHANFFIVIFALNAAVAISSLFVYSDKQLNYKPVALCITYCFISSFVGNYIIKGIKSAYKFTIITTHSDEIIREITSSLHHGITRIEAFGTYTNTCKTLLICVVNKPQLTDFQSVISKYDNTFSFCETVNSTYGNFKKIK